MLNGVITHRMEVERIIWDRYRSSAQGQSAGARQALPAAHNCRTDLQLFEGIAVEFAERHKPSVLVQPHGRW
eukprot:5215838-Prymnesium_polylepis.1